MTAEDSADSLDRARLRKLNAEIERLLDESQLYEAARLNAEARQLARRILRVPSDTECDDGMRLLDDGPTSRSTSYSPSPPHRQAQGDSDSFCGR